MNNLDEIKEILNQTELDLNWFKSNIKKRYNKRLLEQYNIMLYTHNKLYRKYVKLLRISKIKKFYNE